jgi:hypothetical protein
MNNDVSEQDVLANIEAILAAIWRYHTTANELAQLLSLQLSVGISEFNNLYFPQITLSQLGHPISGRLEDADWNYFFEAGDCGFTNILNQQRVRFRLGFSEIGVFNPYHILKFVGSTAYLINVVHFFENSTTFKILKANSYIIEINPLKQISDEARKGLVLAPEYR